MRAMLESERNDDCRIAGDRLKRASDVASRNEDFSNSAITIKPGA
jgi:hypothetical protein